ncbi:MAG: hypothetical protein ACJ72K_08765, partial [Friedmanniella sp.]
LLGAIFGGLFYAVFYPSVFMHRTVTLEAMAATCLIGSILLASRWRPDVTGQVASPLYVGLLVGVSASIKIWGLALVVPLFVWGVAVLGLRRALLIPAGAAAAGLTVCAPFFAVAPQPFWRMVVVAQWGRNPTSDGPLVRIREIIGLSILPGEGNPLLVGLGALLVLGACVLAFRAPIGRLGLLLLAVCVLVLLVTPTWALQYTGLSAVPAAVVAGCSVSALADLLPPAGFRVTAALAFAGIAAYGAAVLSQTWGSPFPGRALAAALAGTSGCVTTDQPIALIETDLLRRNLARDCPLVVDLGGYSYALPPASGTYIVRDRNQRWQRFALEYLSSGDATLPLRHRVGFGFTRHTAATVASWPVIAHVDGYSVRRPVPLPEAK